MRSPSAMRLLVAKELRELSASRAFWLMLIVTGALVGHAFITATQIYAEASGIGGGPAALSQGLSPLEGIVVPTLGAYDLVATLLFPFVVIRLFAGERDSGASTLNLQMPPSLSTALAAKAIALLIGWFVAGLAGIAALKIWYFSGGHLNAAETLTVIFGYALRGLLTIGLGAAAAGFATSAASAAILALTFTIGTWAIDYIAAARGGWVATLAQYTPSAALRVFERGELRTSTVVVLVVLGIGGLNLAAAWLQQGHAIKRRVRDAAIVALLIGGAAFGASRLRSSVDLSEDRRSSFSESEEAVVRQIKDPLHIEIYLAAQDPRLADYERGVLMKLRRLIDVDVTYAAQGRTGLFEKPGDHYGEIWYELNGKRVSSRSTSEGIVLETLYQLAGLAPPAQENEASYSGYPLAVRFDHSWLMFFVAWPLLVIAAWWFIRRPRPTPAGA